MWATTMASPWRIGFFPSLQGKRREPNAEIGKEWKRRVSGNKMELVYRNYLFVLQREREGISFEATCDGNKKCTSLKDFIEDFEQNIYDFETLPPVQINVQALKKCGDRGLGDNGELVLEKTRPNMPANLVFSISEFARLCVTLRDDAPSRKALLEFNNALTLENFRTNFTRDDLWRIIAKRFNDHLLSYDQDISTSVPEACSSEPPLCERSPEKLKNLYQRTRSMFTKRFEDYRRSGNNDPHNFHNFLGPHDKEGNVATMDMKRVWIFLWFAVWTLGNRTNSCWM